MIRSVSGREATKLGLGGAWLGWSPGGIDFEIGKETVLAALELGINVIDTSGGYQRGTSEQTIGHAVSEWIRSGGSREDLVISTKTGTRVRPQTDESYTAAKTKASIESSLSALGTDYIDVAMVHDPPDYTATLQKGYAWDALQELKEEGKVRAIGLGYRKHCAHQSFIATGCCDVCLTHGDFNLLSRTALEGVFEPAAKAHVAVFNAGITVGGFLNGQDPLEEHERRVTAMKRQKREQADIEAIIEAITERVENAHRIWQWCNEQGVNLTALNIQLSTRHPLVSVTLVGASTPEVAKANYEASRDPIPREQWLELKEYLQLSEGEIPFI